MTHKDKQDVISVCNILADKMSDSGKVTVQQIIDAVKDMVENEPCEDTISRATLLEELGEEPFNWNDSPEEYQEVRDYQWFRSLVKNAPSVTPQPKTGRWINNPDADYGGGFFICSECGTEFYDAWKYCPECGSDNREEVDE